MFDQTKESLLESRADIFEKKTRRIFHLLYRLSSSSNTEFFPPSVTAETGGGAHGQGESIATAGIQNVMGGRRT
jgi:hypothetical protein